MKKEKNIILSFSVVFLRYQIPLGVSVCLNEEKKTHWSNQRREREKRRTYADVYMYVRYSPMASVSFCSYSVYSRIKQNRNWFFPPLQTVSACLLDISRTRYHCQPDAGRYREQNREVRRCAMLSRLSYSSTLCCHNSVDMNRG